MLPNFVHEKTPIYGGKPILQPFQTQKALD